MDMTNSLWVDEIFMEILSENQPNAIATISGNTDNPMLQGTVKFYATPIGGILVEAQVIGLPNAFKLYSSRFYGFHIHEKGNCKNNFANTGNHYNPRNLPHPDHAGDMPPLMSSQGFAYSIFYTERFTIDEIIGKSVVIHSNPDDFVSQPSGNAGIKIGCGVIEKV